MDCKYEQVKNYLLELIEHAPAGTRLPSERELITDLGFSRPTIQKALLGLEQDGYIYRRKRLGAYTADRRIHKSLAKLQGFGEEMIASGDKPSTVLVEFLKTTVGEDINRKLGLGKHEAVYKITRLRLRNGVPVMLDCSFFAPFAISGIDHKVLTNSIYHYIETVKGFRIATAHEIISAELPPDEVAHYLNLSLSDPVIRADYIASLEDGRPFEYTVSYKNPHKYVLHIGLHR